MHESEAQRSDGLTTPVRNHYFYGKLLDVYHFQLETAYFNKKRRLLNRLVTGYGVVCGLDVVAGSQEDRLVVKAGLAIDRWGREIVVSRDTQELTIPADLVGNVRSSYERSGEERGACLHVVLCYHECESDPVPILAGDCSTTPPCASGSIREQYRIEFREGCLEPVDHDCEIPDVVVGRRIDHATLARWVSEECPELDEDPCIPLANLRMDPGGYGCVPEEIDITVRPIAYTNDVLFELLLAVLGEGEHPRGPRK